MDVCVGSAGEGEVTYFSIRICTKCFDNSLIPATIKLLYIWLSTLKQIQHLGRNRIYLEEREGMCGGAFCVRVNDCFSNFLWMFSFFSFSFSFLNVVFNVNAAANRVFLLGIIKILTIA